MNLYQKLLYILYRIFYWIQSHFHVKVEKINHYKLYIDNHQQSFLAKYDASLNTNIGLMYNLEESKKELVEQDNHLEKVWKTRLLYQTAKLKNNADVNVLMYYDPYKQGFTYYSDTLVDYDALNVLAMKYVRYFHCIDFFVDEKILNMVDGKSIFLENIKKDKIKTKLTNKRKMETKDELIKNKFIYLGKMVNFSWLKKEIPKSKNIGYSKFKELFN